MPAQFDAFGLRFLYPDNWVIAPRDDDEAEEGVTMELPTGGFFSIERNREGILDEELIEEVFDSIESEYDEVEREEIQWKSAIPGDRAVDFRFYYLDLLIISRLLLITVDGHRYLVQFQAENRDFDANELVVEAIVKQLRD